MEQELKDRLALVDELRLVENCVRLTVVQLRDYRHINHLLEKTRLPNA